MIFILFFLGKVKKTSIPPLLIKKLQITRKNFFLFLSDKFLFIFIWMILLYFWNCHFLYWKPVQLFLLKINWLLPASFFYWKSTRIFLLKINWFLIAILYWKSMKHFLLKNNWFVSFKNSRISLYFLYRDFQRHFSIDFAILLKLPFYIKNQYTFFYWKSMGFCQHHFSTENQYKNF